MGARGSTAGGGTSRGRAGGGCSRAWGRPMLPPQLPTMCVCWGAAGVLRSRCGAVPVRGGRPHPDSHVICRQVRRRGHVSQRQHAVRGGIAQAFHNYGTHACVRRQEQCRVLGASRVSSTGISRVARWPAFRLLCEHAGKPRWHKLRHPREADRQLLDLRPKALSCGPGSLLVHSATSSFDHSIDHAVHRAPGGWPSHDQIGGSHPAGAYGCTTRERAPRPTGRAREPGIAPLVSPATRHRQARGSRRCH
jgi:hypothetical protein